MCKRQVVSMGFYRAMQKPGVHLVTDAIDHVEPRGVVTADGTLPELDAAWVDGSGVPLGRGARLPEPVPVRHRELWRAPELGDFDVRAAGEWLRSRLPRPCSIAHETPEPGTGGITFFDNVHSPVTIPRQLDDTGRAPCSDSSHSWQS